MLGTWWISIGIVNVAVAALIAWRVINTPGLATALLSDAAAAQLGEHDFASYYSENPAADFAFHVWLNNARVTAVCLVMGILIIPVVVVLWANISHLGVVAGFIIDAGRADIFYGLILPHGLLELTVIFVAAGAGLRLGWSWIAPRTSNAQPGAGRRGPSGRCTGARAWCLVVDLRFGRRVRHPVHVACLGEAGHRCHRLARLLDLCLYAGSPSRPVGGDRGRHRRRAGGFRAYRGRLASRPMPS